VEDLRTRARLHPLDWTAIGLLAAGLFTVASGLLPVGDAAATVRRILPLLLFLGTVVILAELTAAAEVFDVIAGRLAIAARGSYPVLFLYCVLLTSATTIGLNLDTTAVLLTPVMLALAAKLGADPLPFAMTTVWLANTASLLLPVSNLTNLLAADRVGLAPLDFAKRMWPAQLAAVAVTAILLWLWYWRRRSPTPIKPIPPHQPADPVLFRVAAAACLLFVGGVLVGVPLGLASGLAAGGVVAGFAWRARYRLRPALLPWRLLVFVTGLFLVVQTIARHGLGEVVGALVGIDTSALGALRTGAAGALMSNVVNNLPAYVAGEAAVPPANQVQLLALLVGTNVGPLALPWASLATLLWYERCRAHLVHVPMTKFVLTGAALAAIGTVTTVAVLVATA
jgi:arsenical pump membrane protein